MAETNEDLEPVTPKCVTELYRLIARYREVHQEVAIHTTLAEAYRRFTGQAYQDEADRRDSLRGSTEMHAEIVNRDLVSWIDRHLGLPECSHGAGCEHQA